MLLAVTATVCSLGAGSAAAAPSPWWRVLTLSAPPSQAGGNGEVVFEASDLGDAPASDEAHPVVAEDTLPAGVQITGVRAEGGGSGLGWGKQSEHDTCSQAGQTAKCTYPLPVLSYEQVILVIDVKVASAGAGSGVNEATVSGGFLPQVTQHQPLKLEGLPPYGVASLELSPEEDGGAPAARAGSHPFQLTSTFALNTQAVPNVNGRGQPELSLEPLGLSKDLRFNVPPGLVVNATAMPRCSDFVFSQQVKKTPGFKCPADTAMGVSSTLVAENRPISPLVFSAPLYNLEPGYGEPARFGFKLPFEASVILDTAVDVNGGDTGATVSVSNISEQGAAIGAQVTFWGWPADPRHDSQRGKCVEEGESFQRTGQLPSCPLTERPPKPFLLMPTSCAGPLGTTVETDSWEQAGALSMFKAATIPTLRACNQFPLYP